MLTGVMDSALKRASDVSSCVGDRHPLTGCMACADQLAEKVNVPCGTRRR